LEPGFRIDIETCPLCGDALWIIDCVEDPAAIEEIFTHLDARALKPEALTRPLCQAPPERGL
jgi:hypothetical protein